MKTKNEKAIKIAIKEGWDIANDQDYLQFNNQYLEKKCELIDLYTSYNGLMPIVERINFNSYEFDKINTYVEICRGKIFVSDDAYHQTIKIFDYDDSTTLLDALLDAVHYVLCGGEDGKD